MRFTCGDRSVHPRLAPILPRPATSAISGTLRRMLIPVLMSSLLIWLPADSQAVAQFSDFVTFRCEFKEGGGRRIEGEKVAVIERDGFSDPLIIDNVSRKARTARLVGNAGGSDLVLLSDTNLLISFAELTPIGGVSYLSIFKRPTTPTGRHTAVFSRHLAFSLPSGSISMTQYYGTCQGQF